MFFKGNYYNLAVERLKDKRVVERYLKVNPMEISSPCVFHLKTKKTKGSKLFDFGKIEGGDWDAESIKKSIESYVVYSACKARVLYNENWEDTGVYERKLKEIERSTNKKIDGCSSLEDLKNRYARLDTVIEKIKNEGFKSQDKIDGGVLEDEMFVSIGRYGEIFLASGGNHRLAIAKALRLTEIPVLVMMRHEKWWQLKLAIERGDCDASFFHPDLN